MHRCAEDRGPLGIPGPYAGLADAGGSNNSPRSCAYRGLPDRRVADASSSRQIGFASGGAQADRQECPEKGGEYWDVQAPRSRARLPEKRHGWTSKSPTHRPRPILHELLGLASCVGKPCGEVVDDGLAFVFGLIKRTVFPLSQAEVPERQAELPGH